MGSCPEWVCEGYSFKSMILAAFIHLFSRELAPDSHLASQLTHDSHGLGSLPFAPMYHFFDHRFERLLHFGLEI